MPVSIKNWRCFFGYCSSGTIITHKVNLTNDSVWDLTDNKVTKTSLLELSLKFLFAREPNTVTLSSFEHNAISKYFSDYRARLIETVTNVEARPPDPSDLAQVLIPRSSCRLLWKNVITTLCQSLLKIVLGSANFYPVHQAIRVVFSKTDTVFLNWHVKNKSGYRNTCWPHASR